jgi:hypothetical protein
VCPHHDIGDVPELPHDDRLQRQIADFLHHGDKTIPPQQQFGGLSRSLLAGLGVPVENRFGLHPAAEPDGSPSPIEKETGLDRLHLLQGVDTFNLHWHLPQLERRGDALAKLDVLARQRSISRHLRTRSRAIGRLSTPCSSLDLRFSPARFWSATRHCGARPPEASTA